MPLKKVHAMLKRSGWLKHRILAAHAVVFRVTAGGGRKSRITGRARACVPIRARRARCTRAGFVVKAALCHVVLELSVHQSLASVVIEIDEANFSDLR